MRHVDLQVRKMALLVIPVLLSFTFLAKKHIQVYMIGDSTTASYSPETSSLTNWGMPFSFFFDSSVTFRNEAQSGRSTRMFIEENSGSLFPTI